MSMRMLESRLIELCRELKLPSIARNAVRLCEEALRQDVDRLSVVVDLLSGEVEGRRERRAHRRIKEAGFPMIKTLESFDFSQTPSISEMRIRKLAEGDYLERAEPVLFLGEPGTGKTHLATSLGMAAAEKGHSVRFVTAARLANELVEARDARELSRIVGRYSRVRLLLIDELGYVPLSRTDAELLFQVLSERQERRAVIVTTNLPFGEWTTVFPDPRLCRALVDRLTHRAHIIETGTESVRLAETRKQRKRAKPRGSA